MDGYLLITELKHPSKVQSTLEASMSGIAVTMVVPPDAVRVDLLKGTDLSNDADLTPVIGLIMQGVKDCREQDAQMGFFSK